MKTSMVFGVDILNMCVSGMHLFSRLFSNLVNIVCSSCFHPPTGRPEVTFVDTYRRPTPEIKPRELMDVLATQQCVEACRTASNTPCICHRCPSGVSAFNNTRKPSFGGPLCFPVLFASCHISVKEPMLILRGLPGRVDSSCCSGSRAAVAPS